MESIFSLDNLVTLGLLTLLQAVLGFDNLLYISLESKHAPAQSQAMVRRIGIAIAIVLRIALLFILMSVIRFFQDPLFDVHVTGIVEGTFNIHSLIVLLGGVVIIYTATKEIWHMMGLEEIEHENRSQRSVGLIVFWIVAMNLVFSFDSILSAIALTDVFWIMAVAIVISGVLMIWLSDRVSEFLQKNRMYEVLGLFILLIVGIMLLSEGGHLAHLKFADQEIVPMSKATFYFILFILVVIDIVQGKYQKKLIKAKEEARKH